MEYIASGRDISRESSDQAKKKSGEMVLMDLQISARFFFIFFILFFSQCNGQWGTIGSISRAAYFTEQASCGFVGLQQVPAKKKRSREKTV